MADASVRGKRSKVPKVVLLVLAAVLAMGAFGLGAWGLFLGFERPIRAEDEAVFVTFDRFAERFPGLMKAPTSEATKRTRYLDGSFEVEYEYETETLRISSSVNHERTSRDARELFTMLRLLLPTSIKLGGDVELVPRSDLYTGGNDSYCAAMVTNGSSAGHALVVLDGKNVFTLIVGGAFLDDPGEFRALVQPRLDAMKRTY